MSLNKHYKKADSLVRKVQNKINKKGAYENAGQPEVVQFRDYLGNFELHYQEECKLLDYINYKVDNLNYNV